MYPATIFLSPLNPAKAWIVDGPNQIPCNPNLTVEEVQAIHKKIFPEVYAEKPQYTFTEKIVKSSKSDKTYKLKIWADGRKECSCPGFTYRHTCKHVEGTL